MAELEIAFGLSALPEPPPRRWPRPSADVLIPEIVGALVERFHPFAIILFGSRARGDHRPDSDVDLLVVLQSVADKRRAAAAMRDALAQIPVAKDIIVATPPEIAEGRNLSGSILRPALRDGKVLYESR